MQCQPSLTRRLPPTIALRPWPAAAQDTSYAGHKVTSWPAGACATCIKREGEVHFSRGLVIHTVNIEPLVTRWNTRRPQLAHVQARAAAQPEHCGLDVIGVQRDPRSIRRAWNGFPWKYACTLHKTYGEAQLALSQVEFGTSPVSTLSSCGAFASSMNTSFVASCNAPAPARAVSARSDATAVAVFAADSASEAGTPLVKPGHRITALPTHPPTCPSHSEPLDTVAIQQGKQHCARTTWPKLQPAASRRLGSLAIFVNCRAHGLAHAEIAFGVGRSPYINPHARYETRQLRYSPRPVHPRCWI